MASTRLLAVAIATLLGAMYCATRSHPCGHVAGIVEMTRINDLVVPKPPFVSSFFESAFRNRQNVIDYVHPATRRCMIQLGADRPSPERWISSFNAFFTMLFQVQSRYVETWQAAQSYHFEREVAEYLGVKRAQYVTSGDAALVVALQALGVGPNDEVVIPTYAPIRTFSSVSINGAIPVMANIDSLLGLDPQSLAGAITPRTKAAIAVHPCNITGIQAVARSRGIALVEDISHIFGSKIFGTFAGTFGAMGFASVDESDFLSSGGQGGLVWADDPELIDNMGFAVENGYAAWGGERKLPSYKRSFGTVGKNPAAAWKYPFAGHCFRAPSEWHAAYARSELQFHPKKVKQFIRLKRQFRYSFEYFTWVMLGEDPHGVASTSLQILVPEKMAHIVDHALGVLSEAVYRNDPWRMAYLPNVTSVAEKVSFHSSGFPWTNEADKARLDRGKYNASEAILKRVIYHPVGLHFTEGMMVSMAAHAAKPFVDLRIPTEVPVEEDEL